MYSGIAIPSMKDTPMMMRLREDDRSQYCNDDIPTAVTSPNDTAFSPPTTGLGINVITAPNLPTTPQTISITPAHWNTRRLATYGNRTEISITPAHWNTRRLATYGNMTEISITPAHWNTRRLATYGNRTEISTTGTHGDWRPTVI